MTANAHCPMTERYPALLRVPPDERQAIYDQAEAGLPLTEEQTISLGLHPSLKGAVLLPATRCFNNAQMDVVFAPANRRAVLRDMTQRIREADHYA